MATTTTNKTTLHKIGWIGAGATAALTLVGAIWLTLEAQSTDPPPEIHVKAPTYLRSRPGRRLPRVDRPKLDRTKLPHRPAVSKPPESIRSRAPSKDRVGTAVKRPPLPNVKSLRRDRNVRAAYRPGRLSPEELRKRREERRARQIDRLRNRIKTLGERIENYRKDGSRTDAQIGRMERSLERMRKRLTRMEEQQKRDQDSE